MVPIDMLHLFSLWNQLLRLSVNLILISDLRVPALVTSSSFIDSPYSPSIIPLLFHCPLKKPTRFTNFSRRRLNPQINIGTVSSDLSCIGFVFSSLHYFSVLVPYQVKSAARALYCTNVEKSQHTDFNEDTTNESASVACSSVRL